MNSAAINDILEVINRGGLMRRGDPDSGDVKVLQAALFGAGHRVAIDGVFGPNTERVVRNFQSQHGLAVDGVVGKQTAALLLAKSGDELVRSSAPRTSVPFATGLPVPQDDTASLIAFYGDPRADLVAWQRANVVKVPCPWTLFYDGKEWRHPIQFHRKAASQLTQAMNAIWLTAQHDDKSPLLDHVRHFSGSGNFRPVRDGSRLSTHAFWAAIDFDAARLPLGRNVPKLLMPEQVVNAFTACGFTWGGNFTGRKDPMHFQYAGEGRS